MAPLDVATEHYIAIGVAGGLWLFVYVPLLIWHGRRYYYNRNHVYVLHVSTLFHHISTYSFFFCYVDTYTGYTERDTLISQCLN